VREAKCTRLGYRIRLRRLHTLDPPLALAFSRRSHLATPNPEQENNQGTKDKSRVPQADPPKTEFHNSNQRQDKEKVTDHMRIKICKNRHKTEAQIYEHKLHTGQELLCSGSSALGSWDPMVVETWIKMLRKRLKHISSSLRLGTSIDAFLRAWTSSVHPLAG
jgi:hypothetical protein